MDLREGGIGFLKLYEDGEVDGVVHGQHWLPSHPSFEFEDSLLQVAESDAGDS